MAPKAKAPLDRSSKQMVAAAQEAALRLGDNHVGTEHLVLALADISGSDLQKAMQKSGTSAQDVRTALSMIRLWAIGIEAVGSRNWKKAVEHYRAALAIKPNQTVANELAWILATCPDGTIRSGEEAVSLMKFVETDPVTAPWGMLDTLAAAHAEVGNFEAAKTWQHRAMERAGDADKAGLASRLAGFENGQPVRGK